MNIRQLFNNITFERLDGVVLLEFVLNKDRAWILAHDDYMLSSQEQQKFDQLAKRRADGEPLAYIIGTKEFYGHNFYVTKDVLIPRPESESFLELLKELKPLHNQILIDVGTGSGALAISVKIAYPNLQVTATDISKLSLNIARKNAILHKTNINFVQSDLFSNINTNFDYIFANLPYVPTILSVSKEVLNEPNIAVFSGKTGLDCITKFLPQASAKCNNSGYVFIESLKIQHQKVQNLAQQYNLLLIKTAGLVQVYQKVVN